ncbi:MAG: HD domain-containing protein [Magnetococcales bacterium]|nr:HD domain-containing protein [Magnetococcales bacterium]
MRIDPRIDIYDLVTAISNAMDLVNKELVNHHARVAYIASRMIQAEYGSRKEESDIILAAMLHDIGAFSSEERFEFLKLDPDHPHRHAEIGYQLLRDFGLFSDPAWIIRFHHVKWSDGRGARFYGRDVPMASHMLHLADRLDILLVASANPLQERESILETIEAEAPRMFHPRLVGVLRKAARREQFWLDLTSPNLPAFFRGQVKNFEVDLTADIIASFAHLLSQLVDFRSRFTATHSSGVSVVAEYIGRMMGFSERECQKLMIAGFLHDIGKLAISNTILEKPGKLTVEEFEDVKAHAYHTARILRPIRHIDDIIEWCGFHHERLNGRGYPFQEVGANIPLAAKILMVADVFTALTEDRPYRGGLEKRVVIKIMTEMVDKGELDKRVLVVLFEEYDDINYYRRNMQKFASETYHDFLTKVNKFDALAEQEEQALRAD